ncbi:MAG: tRNA1(Val) (adenine(37)-N6)-methyltransferase [Desulfohalobiaceae bacterium]
MSNQFPSGLRQPSKGHRFAVDSLLLSCFPRPKPGDRILDLGSGCGVVCLGLLLQNPGLGLQITGLELDQEMVACARENAKTLGLQDSCEFLLQDLRQTRQQGQVSVESFDLVLCNPPYREPGRGRPSPNQAKNRARFEVQANLQDFLALCSFALKNKSHLALVYPAQRLDFLLLLLPEYRLRPKVLRLVHGRTESPASLALLLARKNGGPGLEVQPPLFLYTRDKNQNIPSTQALHFCPFLQGGPPIHEPES